MPARRGLPELPPRSSAGLVQAFDSALVGAFPKSDTLRPWGCRKKKSSPVMMPWIMIIFRKEPAVIKSQAAEFRERYDLPAHYFLSLGRFVAKKNLSVLIRAYRKFLDSSQDCQTHLVMVGSGEEESKFKALCEELRLPVYQKSSAGTQEEISKGRRSRPAFIFMASGKLKRIRFFMLWRTRSFFQACGRNGDWW